MKGKVLSINESVDYLDFLIAQVAMDSCVSIDNISEFNSHMSLCKNSLELVDHLLNKVKSDIVIDSFTEKYDFLSNFYSSEVNFNGITYLNAEAAFQAQKTLSKSMQKEFSVMNPSIAKKRGRSIHLRDDWEDVKIKLMYKILFAKFTQNSDLKNKLLSTGNSILVEGNYWHDNIWGECNCDKCKDITGKNMLGKSLMLVRDQIRLFES